MTRRSPEESGEPGDALRARHDRRDFLAASGAFVLGFWLPPHQARAQSGSGADAPAGASWYRDSTAPEMNAWIVIDPDDSVTIRIAQTELGQGVWTSNAMIVCEELQCDWNSVRLEYASANRDAREMAPAWTLEVPGDGGADPNGGGDPGFRSRAPFLFALNGEI
jgi:CO/xanthine dehydrogenase Mo-binding subunit